jgi:hypothetical protein
MPQPDGRREILQRHDDADEAVSLARIVRRPQLEDHLLLGAEVEHLLVRPALQVPHVQRVPVLAGEQQFRVDAVLDHVRRSPLARDHRVVAEVPPEVIGEVLWTARLLPRAADLEGLRVHDEDAAGPVAVGRAERVEVDAVGAAVRRVQARVARLLRDLLRLDHLHQPRRAGIGLGVQDVDARRAQPRHHEVAPLHVRVRRVGTEARAARVPPEVVQLVPGPRHVEAAERLPVGRGGGVDVDRRERVGPAARVEHRHVGDRFRGCLHGHGGGGIERRVGDHAGHADHPSCTECVDGSGDYAAG